MAIFPDVAPLDPENVTILFRNVKSVMESGAPRVKNKWPFPLRNLKLQFIVPDKSIAAQLWQFYVARKGGYEAFTYYLYQINSYVGEYVGTGDGVTTVYNLPSAQASDYTVYVNGGAQELGVAYTFSLTGGADGADKITFANPPPVGEHITVNFTGYLKIRCRFAEDEMDYTTFMNRIVNTGLSIEGVINA